MAVMAVVDVIFYLYLHTLSLFQTQNPKSRRAHAYVRGCKITAITATTAQNRIRAPMKAVTYPAPDRLLGI